MASSLSNLVDNLAEGIHKIKCKDCDYFVEYENVKDNLIKYKCLSCNKDYSNKLDEKFKKWFKNTFKFSDNDINKFVLLLRQGVDPYAYMDHWETALSEKKRFYSNLNMEDSDSDYMHAKRVCKDSKVKILGGYHDLYLKSDALFLTDVFENLSIKVFKISLKIYHLHPVKFLSHSLILLFQKY